MSRFLLRQSFSSGLDKGQTNSLLAKLSAAQQDPLPGAWTLEVSSAGIDRPLTRVKDWNRFAGHQARVELLAPIDGRRRFTGTVLGADAESARLRLDSGDDITLPLREVRRAKLVLTDALIEATANPGPNPKMAN